MSGMAMHYGVPATRGVPAAISDWFRPNAPDEPAAPLVELPAIPDLVSAPEAPAAPKRFHSKFRTRRHP